MKVRVVLDTQVFISSFFGGVCKRIVDRWKSGQMVLCLSEEIVREYLRVLSRFWVDPAGMDRVVHLLKEGDFILRVIPEEKVFVVPEGGNKFLECALAGKARYLISWDRSLLRLEKKQEVQILSPLKALQKIESKLDTTRPPLHPLPSREGI